MYWILIVVLSIPEGRRLGANRRLWAFSPVEGDPAACPNMHSLHCHAHTLYTELTPLKWKAIQLFIKLFMWPMLHCHWQRQYLPYDCMNGYNCFTKQYSHKLACIHVHVCMQHCHFPEVCKLMAQLKYLFCNEWGYLFISHQKINHVE